MFQSGNHQFLKNLNQKHVLNLLRLSDGLTARELSEQTGLKIATVLNQLKSLQTRGMVLPKQRGPSTVRGGKKPIIWGINPNYGVAIGAEWLSTELRLALIDFNLTPLAQKTLTFPPRLSDAQKVEFFVSALQQFLQNSGQHSARIVGVGIGLAGIIDFFNGTVVTSWSFQQSHFPLKKLLQHQLPYPIYLDNESNVGALGLKWLSPQFRQVKNLLYVTVHQCFSGMGTGFIFEHELYRGRQNATGEWPALFTEAFLNELRKNLSQRAVNHPLVQTLHLQSSLVNLFKEARPLLKQKDSVTTLFWQQIAQHIGHRLQLLVDLLDPECLVIGGDIFEWNKILEPLLQKQITEPYAQKHLQIPKLSFSPFGSFTNALGAATVALMNLYKP